MDAIFRSTLLVATDGSATGERAVRFAVAIAREHGVPLTICHVVDAAGTVATCTTPYGGLEADELLRDLNAASREILERARGFAAEGGVDCRTVSQCGPPAETIAACADEIEAGAIVIGTHGKRGLARMVLGSVAADVLRRSSVPTFVIPPNVTSGHVPIERLLVALDEGGSSDAALAFALEYASSRQSALILCSVVETRDVFDLAAAGGGDPQPLLAARRAGANECVDRAASRCQARGQRYDRAVVEGSPAEAIVAAAALYRADAIVAGTHARRGLSRMLLGSVAERVVRESPLPVAIVRPLRAAARESAPAFGAAVAPRLATS